MTEYICNTDGNEYRRMTAIRVVRCKECSKVYRLKNPSLEPWYPVGIPTGDQMVAQGGNEIRSELGDRTPYGVPIPLPDGCQPVKRAALVEGIACHSAHGERGSRNER